MGYNPTKNSKDKLPEEFTLRVKEAEKVFLTEG